MGGVQSGGQAVGSQRLPVIVTHTSVLYPKRLQRIGRFMQTFRIENGRVRYDNHIIGGYAAGYYSYLWANVLDNDAFEAFKEHGIFDKQTADLFRQNVLEKGDSEDPMTLYKNFRGTEPQLDPMLKNRGMK